MFLLSLPMRGAWIEILSLPLLFSRFVMSLPMRGAWIEMVIRKGMPNIAIVAPHAGSVD